MYGNVPTNKVSYPGAFYSSLKQRLCVLRIIAGAVGIST
jgi:hypothetical protein